MHAADLPTRQGPISRLHRRTWPEGLALRLRHPHSCCLATRADHCVDICASCVLRTIGSVNGTGLLGASGIEVELNRVSGGDDAAGSLTHRSLVPTGGDAVVCANVKLSVDDD